MEKHNFVFYIIVFSAALCLVPLIISLVNFKKINLQLMPIFLLLVINTVMEVINFFFARAGEHNYYIFHYFTVIEFTLISLFYSFFFKQFFNPLLINLLIPVFLIGGYIDSKVNGVNSVNNFSASIESIIIVFYSLFLFYYVLKNLIFENLLSTPIFWLNAGFLFYFSGNMILFVFSKHMAQIEPEKYALLWHVIHTFFNILFNIFLSFGFWKTKEI